MIKLNPQIAALPLPESMRSLKLDPERGFPVPWFVPWVDGKPEFRAMDHKRIVEAVSKAKCWVCGQHLAQHGRTFVIGPMCMVNRVSSEPPSHKECAQYSARACPFLSRPKMVRRDASDIHEKFGDSQPAGMMIERNPGVTLLYTTRTFHPFKDRGGLLFELGEPTAVEWWREGQPATREEVEESVETGLPILEKAAREDPRPGGLAELARRKVLAEKFYPAASCLPAHATGSREGA